MNPDDKLGKIHNPLDVDMRPGLARISSISQHIGVIPGVVGRAQLAAFQWMLGGLKIGSLKVTLPDGKERTYTGTQPGPTGHLVINRSALIGKTMRGAATGFGEAYMDGDWDSPCLADTLHVMMINQPHFKGPYDAAWLAGAARSAGRALHKMRSNTKSGSRKNIQAHYDLGNSFYAQWLDDTMAYSSAVFEGTALSDQPLYDAQRNKFARMLARLDLQPEHHLLEVGSGWGGFAIYAAQQTGCRVTSITLSKEQLAWARDAAEQAGVADRVEFRLQDYRDVDVTYDRIVSIEMYEAVGEEYWDTYFRAIHKALKPGGRAAIQGITIADEEYASYRTRIDFIQKYIFPGGMLASVQEFNARAARAGLLPEAPAFFGKHYAETLRRWDQSVTAHRAQIEDEFDARFYRMWRYYLAYCECGFDEGRIDLMQVTLQRQ